MGLAKRGFNLKDIVNHHGIPEVPLAGRVRLSRYGPIPKKNGRWHVALLAGGPDNIAKELREQLLETRGVELRHHWSYDKSRAFLRKIPSDVDFVLFLKDMAGHADQDAVFRAAKAAGVPVVRTQRKKSAMDQMLRLWGIVSQPSLPVDVRTGNIQEVDGEPSEGAPSAPLERVHAVIVEKPEQPTVIPQEAIKPEVMQVVPATQAVEETVTAQVSIRLPAVNQELPKNPSAMSKTLGYVALLQAAMREEGVASVLLTPLDIQVQIAK